MSVDTSARDQATPNPGKAWYMVAILAVAYSLSFLDRQILALLVGPIKASLHITDTQMSYLGGTAFGVFYAIMGLPISRLVDRASRRQIVFWGVSLWSLMTAYCGLTRGYLQLLLARIGVGVGEASLNPSAFSMVTDSFPPKKRPLAIAVFHLGIPVGQGLALIIGGAVIAVVAGIDLAAVPVFHVEYSWQLVFLLVGLPGLIVAGLMFTIQEPKRRGLIETAAGTRPQQVPLREVASFLSARRLTFFAIYVGVSLKIALGYASNFWVPTYFIRVHHWTATEFGYLYGLITIVVGVAGNFFCGGLANRLAARGHKDAPMIVVLWGYFIAIPIAIVAPFAGSTLAIILFQAATFFTNFHVLAPATLVAITPNQMRGQISALYVFLANIIGLGLGPTVVGIFTDHVFHADASIGYSLSATSAILGPLGAVILLWGLKSYRKCLQDAEAWEQAPAPAE
jgi:MFS family permease